MVPIKNVKQRAEWNKEYETYIMTKKVNMCKSCKNKAHKSCCSEYSASNRGNDTRTRVSNPSDDYWMVKVKHIVCDSLICLLLNKY